MARSLRLASLSIASIICLASPSAAQTGGSTTAETRLATTTFLGDTGLWFVPTGEILPARHFSASGYRASVNTVQGFANIAHFIGTVGFGLGDRVELFGALRMDTRIDRDIRPLFTTSAQAGGLIHDYPFNGTAWSGDHVGDLHLGVKLNLLSEHRQQPVALAVRGLVKVPTGSEEDGVGTGKADVLVDAIISKELNARVEVAGYAGGIWRGQPDDPVTVALSHGFRWGVGAGFPTRRSLRFTTELHGEVPFDDTVTTASSLVGADGSLSPLVSTLDPLTNLSLGLTWQHARGFFVGGGVNWNFPRDSRSALGGGDVTGDFVDVQVRLGYHPGVRVYVAPAPPPPPPPPAAAPEHTLSVKAQCNPCTVEVGKASTVTATAQSSIACVVTYRWSAPTGSFANPAQAQTIWTAPMQAGAVPVTVTVTCPSDSKTASDTVTIQVIQPPPAKELVFEDVHFDFDRYNLRPEATRLLDEAVQAFQANPTLQVQIEGHTCNIGTAEYNLALGERRATSVRDYMISRGVPAARLSTVSYGEERPKYDNGREETRRPNRRAALVVRVQ